MLRIHSVIRELRQVAASSIDDEYCVASGRIVTTGCKCHPPSIWRPIWLSSGARAYLSGPTTRDRNHPNLILGLVVFLALVQLTSKRNHFTVRRNTGHSDKHLGGLRKRAAFT